MPVYTAAVEVHLLPAALDPQGQAVADALHALGHSGVTDVRVGQHVRIRLEAADAAVAREAVERMCRDLLANPVLETYAFTLSDGQDGARRAGRP